MTWSHNLGWICSSQLCLGMFLVHMIIGSLLLVPAGSGGELLHQLTWYSNLLKNKTWSWKRVLWFFNFPLFFFVVFFPLVSLNFWDKLMFDSLHVGLAVCSSVDYVEYFPSQKRKQTLWFFTIMSLPELGGLAGNGPVHHFCTVTDFFSWVTSSCPLVMTAFTSSWWSPVILEALGIKCTVGATWKVGGKSCWHFASHPAGQFEWWLALKGYFLLCLFVCFACNLPLPITYL